ncbi:MAG: RNase adapter RapZ [Elusimicrobiota bacterium]|nr:RNase adapter RapZ [Elusimicrobiota bacterium]
MKKGPAGQLSRKNIIIITGVSGAGKTLALKFLQDAGYFCIDNLPVGMMDNFFHEKSFAGVCTAVGVDIREKGHFDLFVKMLEKNKSLKLIFLESRADILIGRFMENRRRPPLSRSGQSILSALRDELGFLAPLRAEADLVIDTSDLNPWQLKNTIKRKLGFSEKGFAVEVLSFGYKYGLPREADMIYDLRFLPNPNYDAGLRGLTGRSSTVAFFVRKDPLYGKAVKSAAAFLKLIIPSYRKTGKSFMTIGAGCTGGRHRSVVFAEDLKKKLSVKYNVKIFHRDVERRRW